ncbi:MAG TPA: hypothetical protein VFG54_12215 [Prolixibacteraceae bacterium]|nr:hypothetical protein [Prolixibacteraceae bacterium]
MVPKVYIDKDLEEKENEEKVSHEAESARLGNLLLSLQVQSEELNLKREKEVDSMINDFLGYGNS